jgi:hypothetical protein
MSTKAQKWMPSAIKNGSVGKLTFSQTLHYHFLNRMAIGRGARKGGKELTR